MLSNKTFFISQMMMLLLLGAVFIFPSLADADPSASSDASESNNQPLPTLDDVDVDEGIEKTLEYNFSPEDRARLRKALADYARNTDPEHRQIERQRKAMQHSLRERFAQCNHDLDDSLDRQEVTECLPQIARHFNSVDVDADNVITYAELELAQAKWLARRKAAEAKLEAKRIQQAEEDIKKKAAMPKEEKQASTKENPPG